MSEITGTLKKLKSVYKQPIEYTLCLGDHNVLLNDHLGLSLTLSPTGKIYCIHCGRKTNKSFQQGYCFPCLRRLQECNLCIIHPERCLVEQGGCPEDDWAHAQCNRRHVVYLANSSGLKVGITRESQVPTRWIDQGALQALPIYFTSNRYQAGIIEVALKNFVSDRTNWRDMLRNNVKEVDLIALRDELLAQAASTLADAKASFAKADIEAILETDVVRLAYPVLAYPTKVSSLSLDKGSVSGKLEGIKGQYLILDTGVINIRKFGGYEINFKVEK